VCGRFGVRYQQEVSMTKKTMLVLFLAIAACGMVCAAPIKLSVGLGGLGDWAIKSQESPTDVNGIIIINSQILTHSVTGGFFVFFDATYVEVDVDMLFGSRRSEGSSVSTTLSYVGFSALGKLPIAIGPIVLFPLLGIDYQMYLGDDLITDIYYPGIPAKLASQKSELDRLSIPVGVGLDFFFKRNIFIRGEFLWTFKIPNKMELDLKKDLDWDSFTHGPRLKAAIGFRF
jgi:hypothetical protein